MKSRAKGLVLAVALTLLSAAYGQQKDPDKKEAMKGDAQGMMGGG